MRNRRSILCGLVVVAACSMQAFAQPSGRPVVFEGARLLVGDGGEPIERSAILVANDRFVRVGREGTFQVPAGAIRVDLTGKTVIPALIDAHAHIGYMKDLTSGPQNYTRENILDHLQRYDITNSRKISQVYLRGQEINRNALRARWTRPSSN